MRDPDWVVRDINHVGVFYLIDGVTPNVGHLAPLGDQNDVVAFQETDKACKKAEEYSTKQSHNIQDILYSTVGVRRWLYTVYEFNINIEHDVSTNSRSEISSGRVACI